jgi:hypothetical protein
MLNNPNMKKITSSLIIFVAISIGCINAQSQEFLQLRKYSFDNEAQLSATEDFMSETYIPALKSMGFERIGAFRNHAEEGDTTLSLYLLIPVSDVTALYDTDASMMDKFPSEKHYARVENIFLKSFEDMPILEPSKLKGPRTDRIYELRSYESATDKKYVNKVDMFNAGGEIVLFEELGFNAVFYAEVIAGGAMPNLMYMTTHANKDERAKNWKAFVDAPKWKEISSMPKYQKNVSHIDIYFMYPTEYSDY